MGYGFGLARARANDVSDVWYRSGPDISGHQILGESDRILSAFRVVLLCFGAKCFLCFSATTGDVFASKNASANDGVVYSDEGVSFLLCRIRRGSAGRVFRRFVRGALLQCGRTLRRRGTAFVVCVEAVGAEQDCEGSSRYLGKRGCSGEGGDKERERKRVGARVVAGAFQLRHPR